MFCTQLFVKLTRCLRARGLALGYIRCRPLRGLAMKRGDARGTQGSRTRPGLHAVARYAGSR